MFQAPLRLLLTLRPKVPAGVLVATAVSTIVFASTPFLVRGVANEYDVEVGSVGFISTAQLAGFSIATWTAGRWFHPRRRAMVVAIALGIVANTGSGLSPWFSVLVATRFVSGVSLGLIAWIAWAEAFGDDDKTGDVAVIGPIVGTLASPVVANVIDGFGVDVWFMVLAGLHLVPVAFIHSTRFDATTRPHGPRHRPTRAALAILFALGLLTLGGSAVFVFAGVIGQDEIGLSALVVSLAFASNSFASVPSARYRGPRTYAAAWMLVTAICALLIGSFFNPVAFWVALPMWGFAFWMGTPAAFSLLAERSRYPSERAGDAQAVMAAGRVVGPLVGGAAFAIKPNLLGIVGGGVMVVGALIIGAVELRRSPGVLSAGGTS